MKKRKIIILLAVITGILLAAAAVFLIYVSVYYHADDKAAAALQSDDQVSVTQQDKMIVFEPKKAEAGLIFYPGGKVEYSAYAPLMHQLAQKHILCVIVKMPFNLAVFNRNAADGIQSLYPEISRWYMAGHSLGGSMAASYAASHTDTLEGLILLAAYSTEDLKSSNLRVLSVYGSNDGVLNRDKYRSNYGNLPQDTEEYIIKGGNHAFFGSYGEQDGDHKADIAPEEQLRQTADSISAFIGTKEKALSRFVF